MKIVRFSVDTKHRKQWFTGLSFSHPAKMALPLQLWLIENFTKEGETILDPMAGSGTILVACSMGRNVIAVELEQKFVDMMKGNWQKIQERGCQMGYSMGKATILQGDARQLTSVYSNVQQSDAIITSPPFGDAEHNYKHGLKVLGKNFKGRKAWETRGEVDKIITSPPYSEARLGIPEFEQVTNKFHRKSGDKSPSELNMYHPDNPSNIGNLPYGNVDKIITSPPYEGSIIDGNENFEGLRTIRGNKASQKDKFRAIQFGKETTAYGSIDAVISSPPYEGSGFGQSNKNVGNVVNLNQQVVSRNRPVNIAVGQKAHQIRYADQEQANIGNLKSDSYLSAMLQVYQQCHAVLRPGGLMILVTKNFIRNKQQVRLDLDTIKLCEQAGFTYQDRWYRELSSQSFWRTIYHQKYPDVEPIKFEDILVFGK